MGPHRQTVFDQLDLEIIDQVYEAAWAQLLARDPAHDATEEGERQKSLRRRLFAFASRRGGLRHALRQGAD
jgi:hypothetical protein